MKHFFIYLIFIILCSFPIIAEEASNPDDEEPISKAGSDIHGYCDFAFKNDYITPRGLLVTDTGLTVQILAGLNLDVYKNPHNCINKISLIIGVWNDIWTDQHSHTVGSWNELDWFAGAEITFATDWKFRADFLEFLSPPGNFTPENRH